MDALNVLKEDGCPLGSKRVPNSLVEGAGVVAGASWCCCWGDAWYCLGEERIRLHVSRTGQVLPNACLEMFVAVLRSPQANLGGTLWR